MIKVLSRRNLDVQKYNACISRSIQCRVYAYSWYLDIIADSWFVLVLDDYKVVMPLPFRKKLGIKYLYQPSFCQQLGLFSLNEVPEEVLCQFWNKIPFFWWKRTYQFNSENRMSGKQFSVRNNYILNLNTSFEDLLQQCSSNRKRDYKKAIKNQLQFVENISTDVFLNFVGNTDSPFNLMESQIKTLKRISLKKENTFIYGVSQGDELIVVLLGLKDDQRITYLLPLHSNNAKKVGAATFLIIELIRKYQKNNMVLDFEGSMLKGVANFYKSFNAEVETYFSFTDRFFK